MCLIFTVMIGMAFMVTTIVLNQLHHEELLADGDVVVGDETVVDYLPPLQEDDQDAVNTPALGALMAVIGPGLGDEHDQDEHDQDDDDQDDDDQDEHHQDEPDQDDDEAPEESVCTFISGPPCVQSLVTFVVIIVVGTFCTYLFVVFLKFTCCCFVYVIERIKLIVY